MTYFYNQKILNEEINIKRIDDDLPNVVKVSKKKYTLNVNSKGNKILRREEIK